MIWNNPLRKIWTKNTSTSALSLSLSLSIISVDIKKNDVISLSYCQPLHATMQRRIYLKHSKCFDCMCQRCRDPTECGTFIGSLLCSRCKSGKLLPDNPFDSSSDWNCPKCDWQMSATNFQYTQSRLQFAIENIDRYAPYDFEAFLEKYCYYQKRTANGTDDIIDSNILLHERNTFVLQVKYALTQLYGNVSGFLWHGTYLHYIASPRLAIGLFALKYFRILSVIHSFAC